MPLNTQFIVRTSLKMEVSRNVLPDDQLFARLLQLATRKQDEVIVDDQSIGKQFGYRHIIHGTVKLSQKLQGLLDQSVLDNRGRFYVAVLAPNGYEFIIAVLAVLAIGGVVVPMRKSNYAQNTLQSANYGLLNNSDWCTPR